MMAREEKEADEMISHGRSSIQILVVLALDFAFLLPPFSKMSAYALFNSSKQSRIEFICFAIILKFLLFPSSLFIQLRMKQSKSRSQYHAASFVKTMQVNAICVYCMKKPATNYLKNISRQQCSPLIHSFSYQQSAAIQIC